MFHTSGDTIPKSAKLLCHAESGRTEFNEKIRVVKFF